MNNVPHTHKCVDHEHDGKPSWTCWDRNCTLPKLLQCGTCQTRRLMKSIRG